MNKLEEAKPDPQEAAHHPAQTLLGGLSLGLGCQQTAEYYLKRLHQTLAYYLGPPVALPIRQNLPVRP